MRPFTDQENFPREEVAFNTAHSKTRVVVEKSLWQAEEKIQVPREKAKTSLFQMQP